MSQMFLNVVSTFKGDGIQQATRQLGAFGKQTSSFGSILGKVATGLAAFGVATKAVQFGRETITAARDLERNLYALDTIFGDLSPTMRNFAKDAENIGLSQSKAAKASSFIGSVLKQSGFAMSDVSKETKNLVTLGTDLAALYGYDVQEALLGMTALFRGEYDPIEKFGVAMKQSEINAELAARGQDKLEGAARRNAEQTVRLELLYERAADAMGAFTNQSGSLYTEQKKLGATFENMQAQLGAALLPAVVSVNEELRKMLVEATPGLIDIFNVLADGLESLVGIFRDSMDPTTELGESFSALGIQFNSLWNTIFGKDFNIAQIFEAGAFALGIFIDLVHDLLRFVENTIIIMQVLGEQMHALITLDWDKFFGTNWNAEIKNRMDLTSATKDFKLQSLTASQSVKDLRDAVADADKAKLENLKTQLYGIRISAGESAAEMRRLREQAGLPPITGTKDDEEEVDTDKNGATAKPKADTGLSAYITKSKKEAKIYAKEFELLAANLSEDVVQALLSTTTPIQTANEALARISRNGQQAIDNITNAYMQSAAGQKATAEALDKATAQAEAGLVAWTENAKKEAAIAALEIKLIGAGLSAAVAASLLATTNALQTGQEALDAIAVHGASAIASMTENFNSSADGQRFASEAAAAAAAAAAELAEQQREAARAAEEAARAEAAVLAERERVFKSFQDSVKNTFSGIKNAILGAFDITALGGSTKAIMRNMEKMLVRLRSFATNVKQLATMGLNPELLQQVINMGPMAGSRLASALVQGGASSLSAINVGFGEFGSLSSDIARTGAERMFDTEAQRNVYNINVGGGVGSGATIGKAIVDAIKDYERTSGAVWQGA
jgi:hypothetical protein